MTMFRLTPANNHESVRPLLSPYIDNRVNPEERARVDAHLATCPRCQTELSQLRSLVGGLRALPPVAVTRSFAVRPGDLRAPVGSRPVGVFFLRGLAGALAACMVLLFGLNVVLPAGRASVPVLTQSSREATGNYGTVPAPQSAPSLAAGRGGIDSSAKPAAPGAGGATAGAPTIPATPPVAPAAGALTSPAAAAAPALAAPQAAPAPAAAQAPQATPERTADKAVAPAAVVTPTGAPSPTPEQVAVATAADRARATSTGQAPGADRALWVAEVTLALFLVLALVGAFLGRSRGTRP